MNNESVTILVAPIGAPSPLFAPGSLVATPGAIAKKSPEDLGRMVTDHLAGRWGDLDKEDATANDRVLAKNASIGANLWLQSSFGKGDDRIWIITVGAGAERTTTLMLPREY